MKNKVNPMNAKELSILKLVKLLFTGTVSFHGQKYSFDVASKQRMNKINTLVAVIYILPIIISINTGNMIPVIIFGIIWLIVILWVGWKSKLKLKKIIPGGK